MAALHALLEQERVRLVTLTGAGGSGKTRLAIELASELGERFDRAWFVDLTAIDRPELVPPALGDSIGIREASHRELMAVLREMLSVGRFLVIFDNFEHVIDGGSYVAQLLAGCRDLVVVATSREALRVRAEHVFQVEPLATPKRGQLDDIAALRSFASVELFEERARAAQPTFAMTDDVVPTVAEICLDLDGLPLAIELVAAQAGVLTPREILVRLEMRAPLVTAGPRDLPLRHQTLEATVRWSYDLLTPGEQTLLRVSSVFAGSFTLAAVRAVRARSTDADGDPVATLLQLVAKSMVRQASQPDGRSRFWLLDTIRAFAHDRLIEADELADAQRRHAQYYVVSAEQLQASMASPGVADALDALAADYANFRAVFQWSAAHDELEYGLRLAGALYRFWIARGHLAEARAWLEAALERSHRVPPDVRAVAFNAAGVMAGVQHDHQPAIAFFTHALELWRGLGDVARQAGAALNLGFVAQNVGQLDNARRQFEEAQQLYTQMADRGGQARAIASRARIAREQGDLWRALDLLDEALALFRELGDGSAEANSLVNLGHVKLGLEDRVGAKQAFCEALVVLRELNNVPYIAECFEGLAAVALADEPRLAVRLLGAADMLRESAGAPVPANESERYSALIASVRASLTAVMFRAGWNAGRALSLRGALDLAVRDEPLPAEPVSAEPAPTSTPSLRELDALSAREREIAVLIALGRSNREIADELVLSVKTVETHVKHIFRKLDVRNRAGVAAIVGRGP